MDFMDYSTDSAKFMFTVDNSSRMLTAMINSPFRNQLGTHNQCSEPIGISPGENYLPEKFILFQNFPDTFNPLTKIKFYIFKTSLVKFINYDALGREINNLVNSELISGNYEAEFDGKSYPSGIYYYELSAGEFSETKKMVLLK